MAYLSIDRKNGEQYIRIMQSVRVNGKKSKKTLHSLGKVSDYTPEMLKRMGKRLYELGGGELKELLGDDTQELARLNYGYYQCVVKVLKHYGLDDVIRRDKKGRKIQFNLSNCLKLMLIERLHAPASKRRNYLNQEDYLGVEEVPLHHLYRTLDYLSDQAQSFQKAIFTKGRNLFNQRLDVVFYDVTTFYFCSDKSDDLREKGFSKDGKQGKVQIVFGLLIDKDKQPVGYEIYKGNYFEGKSFEDAIKRLKDTYQIDKIIIVADRGMLNRNNIKLVEDTEYEFIMGERLKSLPRKLKDHLTSPGNYNSEWAYKKDEEEIKVRYCLLEHEGRTIIGTWSQNRANKDQKDRQEKLDKAQRLLENPSQLSRKAQRFFIKDDTNHQYYLNEDKIKQAEKYDGYLAISTNNKSLPPTEILDHYRHLFEIEHSFRTFKSHLETRPMFHWTQKRIEGHICLCYISYAIQNYLRQKLASKKVKLSDQALRRNLDKMQLSLVKTQDKAFYIRSNNQDQITQIIQKLGLKPIPSIFPKDQIVKYL